MKVAAKLPFLHLDAVHQDAVHLGRRCGSAGVSSGSKAKSNEEAARKVLRAHSRRQSFKASPEDKKKKDRKLSLLDTKGNDNNPL